MTCSCPVDDGLGARLCAVEAVVAGSDPHDTGGVTVTSLYLAGRFASGPQLEARADEARGLGLAVTSRWHAGSHGTPGADSDLNDPAMPRYAREDIEDLLAADVVVSFTEGGGGKGGRHVEFGLGLGYRKRLVVVGPREHVFHTLPTVEQYDTWSLALGALMVDTALTEYLDDTTDVLGQGVTG